LKITDSIHPELGVVQNKKKKVTIKLHNDKNAKYKKTRRNLHDN
jgi:transcription initiation factor IIE alpha subunit